MDKVCGGFISEKIKPLDAEFGGMTPIVESILFPDANHKPYLPDGRQQVGVYFDDWGCVSHAILNAIKTYLKRVFPYLTDNETGWLTLRFIKDDKIDFSHRDLVVLSGTKIGVGNSVSKVLETVQDIGVIPYNEGSWDFSNRDPKVNIPEVYYSYKRTDRAEEIAQEWNDRLYVEGEWVHRNLLENACKYGTVVVAVNAWYKNSKGEFYNPTGSHNHLVQVASYSDREIFDSYKDENGSYIKKLSSWDDIRVWARKINITRKYMEKPKLLQNALVILVEGAGAIGLHLDDQIIIDDVGKVLSVFMARNAKNGNFNGGPVVSLKQEDWNKFTKIDLAGRPL